MPALQRRIAPLPGNLLEIHCCLRGGLAGSARPAIRDWISGNWRGPSAVSCMRILYARRRDAMTKGLLIVVVAGIIFTTVFRAQTPTPLPAAKETQRKPAVPLEPITAIIEAFQSHPVVAIANGEVRGNPQSPSLQLPLIRGPPLAAPTT